MKVTTIWPVVLQVVPALSEPWFVLSYDKYLLYFLDSPDCSFYKKVTVQESTGEKTTAEDKNRKKRKGFTKITLTITHIVGTFCCQGRNGGHATL
jgi:hypothetical protein